MNAAPDAVVLARHVLANPDMYRGDTARILAQAIVEADDGGGVPKQEVVIVRRPAPAPAVAPPVLVSGDGTTGDDWRIACEQEVRDGLGRRLLFKAIYRRALENAARRRRVAT